MTHRIGLCGEPTDNGRCTLPHRHQTKEHYTMHIVVIDTIQNLIYELANDDAKFSILEDGTIVVDHPDSQPMLHINVPID